MADVQPGVEEAPSYTSHKPGSDEHRRFYAQFANAAYNSEAPVPEGYSRDAELSDKTHSVFVNSKDKHVVLAHRGTVPNWNREGLAELATDAFLAKGRQLLTPRFRKAVAFAKTAQAKYGKDHAFTATGHSLGASQAAYLNDKLGIPAVTYSSHTPMSEITREITKSLFKRITRGKKGGRETLSNYTTLADPIALNTTISQYPRGNTYIVKTKTRNPHSLQNFL